MAIRAFRAARNRVNAKNGSATVAAPASRTANLSGAVRRTLNVGQTRLRVRVVGAAPEAVQHLLCAGRNAKDVNTSALSDRWYDRGFIRFGYLHHRGLDQLVQMLL